jgi:hypothetical protein
MSSSLPIYWCHLPYHATIRKCDINDPLYYRIVTTRSSISKLYASVLDKRIHGWAESRGIRARGQAGFRRGLGTIDNPFTLWTILDQRSQLSRQHATKKPTNFTHAWMLVKKHMTGLLDIVDTICLRYKVSSKQDVYRPRG